MSKSSASQTAIPNKIPLWVYFIQTDTGTISVSQTAALNAVNGINPYFSGLFSFSVCGTSVIQSSEFNRLDLSEFNALCDYVNGLNEPLDDKCIKVFFVDQIHYNNMYPSGYGWAPLNTGFDHSGIALTFPEKRTVAHEIGHYFSLSHTFAGGQPQQYVTTDPNDPAQIALCETTGDMLCDTEADLETIYFDNNCTTFGCTVCTDPAGVPYNPDPTLLMSYHHNCSNRFTQQQRLIMRTLFQFDANYEQLRSPESICINPEEGRVIANCAGGLPEKPLKDLEVDVLNGGNTTCALSTNEQGKYFLNNLISCQFTTPGQRLIIPQKNLAPGSSSPLYLAPYNGVDAYDLVLISRHILNLEPFDNPYKFISADVNLSGTITSFDIVTTRAVILGTFPNFPAGSWRYVPNLWFEVPLFSSAFNSNNPFAATVSDPFSGVVRDYNGVNSWMDRVSLNTTVGQPGYQYSNLESSWAFTGTKVGDVNCDADPDAFGGNDPVDVFFTLNGGNGISAPSNTTKDVKVVLHTPAKVSAWQMGLSYSLSNIHITQATDGNSGMALSSDNFSLSENTASNTGQLNAVWYSEDGTAIDLNNKALFTVKLNIHSNISQIEQVLDLNSFAPGLKFFDGSGNQIHNIQLSLEEVSGDGLTNNGLVDRGIKSVGVNDISVKVSPVPFTESLRFTIHVPNDDNVTLSVFDITGRLMFQKHEPLVKGWNDLEIQDLTGLPTGVYTYVLRSGTVTKTGKLIK